MITDEKKKGALYTPVFPPFGCHLCLLLGYFSLPASLSLLFDDEGGLLLLTFVFDIGGRAGMLACLARGRRGWWGLVTRGGGACTGVVWH